MPSLLTTLIRKFPPVFAPGFCWGDPQSYANLLVAGLTLEFASDVANIGYNQGGSLPDAENRVFPWLRLNPDGGFDAWYFFALGTWVTPFGISPGDNGMRYLYVGLEASVPTLDGGEAVIAPATATAIFGPFWEIDHDFDGRSPMGPGVIPDATPAKTLAVVENFGEGSRLQGVEEIGSHTHALGAGSTIQDGDNVHIVTSGGGSIAGLQIGGSGNADTSLSVQANEHTTNQEKMPIIHPVRGTWFLKRTSRIYRRIDV